MTDAPRPSFAEARRIVHEVTRPGPVERVDLAQASGRVLARDVVATRDSPPFDMAAMDGFAVPNGLIGRHDPLPLAAPVFAGEPASGQIMAHPIATGAPVPSGTALVVTRERAELVATPDGPRLWVREWGALGANLRRRGEDGLSGDTLMAAGGVVSAEAVGALASFGVGQVEVVRMPTLAIVTTGDELVPVDARPRASQLFNSNAPMIAAMAARGGVPVVHREHVGDDEGALARVFERLADTPADILVTTAGVSVGDRDRVREATEGLGATVHLHGVRMRPGKPVLLATLPGGMLHIGLPGNPVAAAVAMRFFVLGSIRAALGLPLEPGCPVTVGVEARPDTTLILKARRTSEWGLPLKVELAADQRSHTLRPLLTTDCWLVVPPASDRDAKPLAYSATALLSGMRSGDAEEPSRKRSTPISL